MRIQPDSTITLYSGVDIDMGSGVQIAFSSLANQNSYFASKLVMQEVPCTVVKKTGRIRLQVAGSTVKNCNYISFINPSFDNKRIYARILDYDYINNECTEITWLIDFWQTWMFDINFEESGIVRQYLNEADYIKAATNPYDPSIYAFQTPEALPYGDGLEEYSYEYETISQLDNDIHKNTLLTTYGDNYRNDLFNLSGVIVLTIAEFNVHNLTDSSEWWSLIDSFESDFAAPTNAEVYYLNTLRPSRYVCGPNSSVMLSFTPGNPISTIIKGSGYLRSSFTHPQWIIGIPLDYFYAVEDTTTYPGHTLVDTGIGGVDWFNKFVDFLTTNGLDRNILSATFMPDYMFRLCYVADGSSHSGYDGATYEVQTGYNAKNDIYPNYKPSCNKLYTFPYAYLRLENDENQAKELQFEQFVNVQSDATSKCELVGVGQFNVTPFVSIAPKNYKQVYNVSGGDITVEATLNNKTYRYVSYDPHEVANINFNERLDMSGFPQIPIVTDGYLTYLSQTYLSFVANNNIETQKTWELKQGRNVIDTISTGLGIGGEAAGSYAEAAAKGGNIKVNPIAAGQVAGNIAQAGQGFSERQFAIDTYYNKAGEAHDILGGSAEYFGNIKSGEEVVDRYNDTKAAFASNVYNAGTVGGLPNFLLGKTMDFKLTYVKLRDAILEKYDKYFKTYGYNFAGVVGVPYVVKYTQGLTGNNNLPHWEQVSGKDSTYVRTQDCHCTHSMLPVATAIEGMFNSGIRMLKGETL